MYHAFVLKSRMVVVDQYDFMMFGYWKNSWILIIKFERQLAVTISVLCSIKNVRLKKITYHIMKTVQRRCVATGNSLENKRVLRCMLLG